MRAEYAPPSAEIGENGEDQERARTALVRDARQGRLAAQAAAAGEEQDGTAALHRGAYQEGEQAAKAEAQGGERRPVLHLPNLRLTSILLVSMFALRQMYDKLTVKTKWLKGGGEAKADLERYMQSYHCGEKNEEDDEDDRAEPVSFASVREAGTQLINADNAKRSKLKAKGKAQVQPPAATPKLVAPGGELQVYEGAAPEAVSTQPLLMTFKCNLD